jgi:hypothetical protein
MAAFVVTKKSHIGSNSEKDKTDGEDEKCRFV